MLQPVTKLQNKNIISNLFFLFRGGVMLRNSMEFCFVSSGQRMSCRLSRHGCKKCEKWLIYLYVYHSTMVTSDKLVWDMFSYLIVGDILVQLFLRLVDSLCVEVVEILHQ